jgi:hypothetical protein
MTPASRGCQGWPCRYAHPTRRPPQGEVLLARWCPYSGGPPAASRSGRRRAGANMTRSPPLGRRRHFSATWRGECPTRAGGGAPLGIFPPHSVVNIPRGGAPFPPWNVSATASRGPWSPEPLRAAESRRAPRPPWPSRSTDRSCPRSPPLRGRRRTRSTGRRRGSAARRQIRPADPTAELDRSRQPGGARGVRGPAAPSAWGCVPAAGVVDGGFLCVTSNLSVHGDRPMKRTMATKSAMPGTTPSVRATLPRARTRP